MLSYFIAEVGSGIRFWFVVHYSVEKPVLDCSDISFLAMCTLYVKVDWTELYLVPCGSRTVDPALGSLTSMIT
jgi:hypothetical protein